MALRGAIIGVGGVALHGHLPGWLERRDVEIVAGTDVVPAREETWRRRLPGARWYRDAGALLAGEALDFVDICTPPGTHAGLARAALQRGLHVLCEKPLVCRPEELRPLADLAGGTGRVLHTVHNWRHAPVIRKAGELVRQGAIGEVRACRWETLRTGPAGGDGDVAGNWRLDPEMAGGGILMDHGWHALYVVHGWLGRPPRRIAARLETRRHARGPLEDTATVRLEYAAAEAEIFLTWAADQRRNSASLEGSGGTIRVEDDAVVLAPSGSRGPGGRWACPPPLSGGSYHPDWFAGVAAAFVAEVTGPPAGRGANLEAASLCATLVDRAQASSRHGGSWLPIPELMVAETSRPRGEGGLSP
jgi:predicted dehydrogenase